MDPLQKNKKIQNIYFYVSLGMLLLSTLLFMAGYVLTQNVIAAPDELISFSVIYFNYHYIHFIAGFGLLMYYHVQKKKHAFEMKVVKTLLGIFTTPFSYIILLIGILLLGLSSCAGS
jgi:FtsH-binding integral membrane protein